MTFLFQATLIIVFLQFAYWLSLSIKLFLHHKELKDQKPTSVVICAKNEAHNLKEILPLINAQSHLNYDITVGDDFSSDNTKEILFKHGVNHILATNDIKGKKQVLEDVVASVKNPFVLVTDADCRPSSEDWIQQMTPRFDNSIVLSYGPLFKESGLLNRFARFETFLSGLQYLSFALYKRPYMGVGRNLLFPKALFQKIGGLSSHKEIISGDDDLFIQEIAKLATFEVSIDPKSFMFSKAKSTVKDYIHQKKRHISTSKHYRFLDQILLSFNPFCQIFVYAACLSLVLLGNIKAAGIILLIKWILQIIALSPAAKKLKEQDLLILTPILDLIFLLYLLYFIPSAFFKDEKNWS